MNENDTTTLAKAVDVLLVSLRTYLDQYGDDGRALEPLHDQVREIARRRPDGAVPLVTR